ncbi:hypothetical protein ACOBQB_32845 [Streptomyces sp. G5(2025)]|uniref:hypothetical protein n=1 Tax=Streptomyces sp. G5(2025) TaxID=3406628 RepID=UPI003C1AF689
MRMVRRLAALAAGAAMVLVCAPQAAAGGVTSVVVASPETSQIKALHGTDEEYGKLQTLLGPPGLGRDDMPPGLEVGDGARQISVTWLIHDVRPGRVDRVYPRTEPARGAGADAEDIWIHTSTDVATMDGSWHKADDPAALRALLKKIGVLGKASADGRAGVPPPTWSRPDARPAPTRAADRVEDVAEGSADGPAGGSAADGGMGWRWAIPGAAGGAVAGAAGVLLLRRREPGAAAPGSRQEVIDVHEVGDVQEVSWRRE